MDIALVYPERPAWPKMHWVRQAFDAMGHCTRHIVAGAKHGATAICDELEAADRECGLVLFSQKSVGLHAVDLARLAERRQSVWAQWWFDLLAVDPDKPLREQSVLRERDNGGFYGDAEALRIMRLMDFVFVKERGMLSEYRAIGVNARYLDQACPSWLAACEHRAKPEWDVLVFGSRGAAWNKRRGDVRSLVREGFTVAWAGHPDGSPPPGCRPLPFCPPEELPALASRAAVVLGVDARHDVEGYWSDRLWLSLGMGACHVRRWVPGLSCGYGTRDCAYESIAGLRDHVAYLCKELAVRQAMGQIARRYVMANHTYEHRVTELLEQCNVQAKESAEPAAAAVA